MNLAKLVKKLPISNKGALDHAEALANAGYEIKE